MTTMIAEVYDALLQAGAGEEKSRRAAEALAGHEDRFDRLERKVDAIDHKVDTLGLQMTSKIDSLGLTMTGNIEAVQSRLHAEQVLIRWMLATFTAVMLAVAVKIFLH